MKDDIAVVARDVEGLTKLISDILSEAGHTLHGTDGEIDLYINDDNEMIFGFEATKWLGGGCGWETVRDTTRLDIGELVKKWWEKVKREKDNEA